MSYIARMRLVAAAAFLHGALMTFSASGTYSSGSYTVLFRMADQRIWGVAFMLAGALAFAWMGRSWWTSVPLTGLFLAWALGLFAAIVTGDAESLSGPIWVTVIAVVLATSTANPQRTKS